MVLIGVLFEEGFACLVVQTVQSARVPGQR